MRLRNLSFPVALFILSLPGIHAQTTLFTENFDACVLSAGWQVHSTGNQNPWWTVGYSVNDDAPGQSINGSCCLLIDDDQLGDNTPAYVLDFISPPFDASQHSTVALSVDVHYRDWAQAKEYFQILVTDGVNEYPLSRFENTSTGDSLGEYITVRYDLALLTKSPAARLIFRYDDAGGYNWWAAIDNITVVGSGNGTNVVTETFNGCAKPTGWETQIVTGQDDWRFGLLDTNSNARYNGTSMDGTCFAYFDDDQLGQAAPFSTTRLISPWFSGTDFARFELNFDLILRYYKEHILVIVQAADGTENVIQDFGDDVGGPYFPDYEHLKLNLTPYRSAQMRVIFEYNDGNDFGWWAGIDNVKVTGEGESNDICANAIQLLTGDNCRPGENTTAIFDGPPPACVDKSVGSLWYTWQPAFTGLAKVSTHAQFNDVVSVFTGGCANLQPAFCDNRDEHGFTGESTYFPVQAGTTYRLRVSGRAGNFGVARGALCIEVDPASAYPPKPANDDCANAVNLAIAGACVAGNNINATTSATLPSLNELARGDVWYTFTAGTLAATEQLVVESNATFSDIITLYKGSCAALTEVAGNHKGRSLTLPALTAGQTYYVQIAGNFATVEGDVCPQIVKKVVNAPANDNCINAINVPIGGACMAGNARNAAKSGYTPACVPSVAQDIWFKFVAPTSGAVRINTGARFEHILGVWTGNCSNLQPFFCAENPLRCDGYILLGNLAPGQTYYLQIATRNAGTDVGTGEVCVKIIDGNSPPDFEPLTLSINENCTGVGTAQLNISTTGGVAPLTFQGSPNGQELASGTVYLVVVRDAMGCEKSKVDAVDACNSSACALSATLTATQPTCYNGTDGALSVNTLSGTAPYSFKWSNGSTDAMLTGISSGIYVVTVTDATGCETIVNQTLINPLVITATVENTVPPNQGQSNGALFIEVNGGSGTYTYSWIKDGITQSTTQDLTNAPAGTYELRITDSDGCTVITTFVLSEIVNTDNPATAIYAEIFPNPAVNETMLTIALPKMQDVQLSIIDAAGRTLHSWTVKHVTEQQIPFDVTGLPTAVYQLQIQLEGETIARKFVVND